MHTKVKTLIMILTVMFTFTGLSSNAEAHSLYKNHKLYRQYKAYHQDNYGRRAHHVAYPIPQHNIRVVIGGQAYYFMDGVYYQRTSSGYYPVETPQASGLGFSMDRAQKVYVDDVKYYEMDGVFYKPVEDGFVIVNNPHVVHEQKFVCGDKSQGFAKPKSMCAPAPVSCSVNESVCPYDR